VIVGRIEPLTVGDTADTADTADAADPVATPGVGSEM
jgi:hypothetical protein